MGFIGYFVKLIHIPINNILVCVFSPFCPLSNVCLLLRDDVCGLGRRLTSLGGLMLRLGPSAEEHKSPNPSETHRPPTQPKTPFPFLFL